MFTKTLFNNDAARHTAILAHLTMHPHMGETPIHVLMHRGFNSYVLMANGETIEVINGEGETVATVSEKTLQSEQELLGLQIDSIDAMLHEVAHGRPAIGYVDVTDASILFDKLWSKLTVCGKTKSFQAEWANGTGYFIVTRLPEGPDHDTFAFTDDHGRQGIVLWDSLSQSRVVVFQRYCAGGLVAYNSSFGSTKGVSGSGAVHVTPYIFALMADVVRYASLNV